MVYWRFMVDRRLSGADAKEYEYRAPLCQVCGVRTNRLAIRLHEYPYQWTPVGWYCVGCSIIDVENVK